MKTPSAERQTLVTLQSNRYLFSFFQTSSNDHVSQIQVENSGQQRSGTVRIFLAPKFDERGRNYLFRDQRTLFVEMDKFTVNREYGRPVGATYSL